MIVATNEAGICGTEVDLYDLVDWLQAGPGRRMVLDNGSSPSETDFDPAGDVEGYPEYAAQAPEDEFDDR